MPDHEFTPPDYAILDGADAMDEAPPFQVVRWYERPGWPLGKLPPNVALLGAFGLGMAAGIGLMVGVLWVRDQVFGDD